MSTPECARLGHRHFDSCLRTVVLDPDGQGRTLLGGRDGFEQRVQIGGGTSVRPVEQDRNRVATGAASADGSSAGDAREHRVIVDVS